MDTPQCHNVYNQKHQDTVYKFCSNHKILTRVAWIMCRHRDDTSCDPKFVNVNVNNQDIIHLFKSWHNNEYTLVDTIKLNHLRPTDLVIIMKLIGDAEGWI